MKNWVGWSAMALMLTGCAREVAETPVNGTKSQSAQTEAVAEQGLCRRPAALASLPPESAEQVIQNTVGSPKVMATTAPPPPPPPPSPEPVYAPPPVVSATGAEGDSSEIAVTASRRSEAVMDVPVAVTSVTSESLGRGRGPKSKPAKRPVTEAALPPSPPPIDYPRPQSGTLTAGEHDDLLNPELYAHYVKNSKQDQQVPDVPKLDTRRVLTIAVTDNRGQPMPFVTVRASCSDGNSLRFDTLADGTVAFFPAMDRLGSAVSIDVMRGDQTVSSPRKVAISRDSGGQRISIVASGTQVPVRKFDLALVVDATGSMSDEIQFVKAELRGIVDRLIARHPGLDIRIGTIFYRDIGDEYVTRTADLSGKFDDVQNRIAGQWANGGGDYPEAMDQAMNRAINLGWREGAVRSLLLVADAPPHGDKVGLTWQAAEAARAKRIQIVPVAASGVADTAEYVMRGMAAMTQSRYLFLTDDSGVGNPHAPPAIDCYQVTRLDHLVARVLDSQISGRRIEPEKSEVIRSVGKYDAGKCILPRDFNPDSQ